MLRSIPVPSESSIIDPQFRHPLIGTWVLPDDSPAEYTVHALGDTPAVSGVDSSDGEVFVISDAQWDGTALRFTSLMPSTSYELTHILRPLADDTVEHEWTRVEVWHRKR
jgi:hypothetical protein